MAYEDKTASPRCIVACYREGEDVELFVGRTNGKLLKREKTEFGWDAVFERTNNEMKRIEKRTGRWRRRMNFARFAPQKLRRQSFNNEETRSDDDDEDDRMIISHE